MRILLAMGTRPEAIKMAPLALALQTDGNFEFKLCLTAQHRELLDNAVEFFGLEPDFDLDSMNNSGDLTELTSSIIKGMEKILQEYKPDLVLVHGDTTSSFAVSLAATYQKIPIAHIEAGLRTGNNYSPWPEEINRKLISSLASLHFAPLKSNRDNLIKEGVDPSKIFITGNTVIDALKITLERIEKDSNLSEKLKEQFNFLGEDRKLVLITAHRRESLGQGLRNICTALKELANNFPEIDFVYPVHPNPRVKGPVTKELSETTNVYLIEPVNYATFVYLMNRSYLILTDSGGIQEEAPSLNKPVLVMRVHTERQESIDLKSMKLIGTEVQSVVENTTKLLQDSNEYKSMQIQKNPYGDGQASKRIVNQLIESKKNDKV